MRARLRSAGITLLIVAAAVGALAPQSVALVSGQAPAVDAGAAS